MNDILTKSLYKRNNNKFQKLRNKAKEFNATFNGNNIVQDDIFRIMANYARKQGVKQETMFLPIQDDDICAFTCIRKGMIFVVINSSISLAKQIYAAAHELYHMYCYFEERDNSLLSEGSLLTSDNLESDTSGDEDIEANAFAALLLVPATALNEQMDIYGIDKAKIGMKDILVLMDVFAVPYKAMILRLYEEGYLKEKATQEFLQVSSLDIMKKSRFYNYAVRWQRKTPENINLGRLQGLVNSNAEMEVLPEQRISEDRERLSQIVQEFEGKRGKPDGE